MLSISFLFEDTYALKDNVPKYGMKVTVSKPSNGFTHIVARPRKEGVVKINESTPVYNITNNPAINNKFLIHEHKAVRAGLHWDLRLGHDGVLKSFASKKLPDVINDKAKKIALFQQPDHDSDWFDFHGEISDGYGAGKVSIWDKGNFDIVKWTQNVITLDFAGKKLKGNYSFVLYKQNEWLMFKSKDFQRFVE